MTVVYLEIDDATNADRPAGVADLHRVWPRRNPDLKAIFIDHGNLTRRSRPT